LIAYSDPDCPSNAALAATNDNLLAFSFPAIREKNYRRV
jgi:hypothetical protein